MILLTTTLSLRAKREGSYVHGAPSAQAVFDRNCAVNQAVRAYGHWQLFILVKLLVFLLFLLSSPGADLQYSCH
jgi:hypothetical protein